MKPFVRRSHLVIDVTDADAAAVSWTHDADAVILTLPEGSARIEAREGLTEAIDAAALGGAEVFIQARGETVYADLIPVNSGHFSGVVAHGVESAADVVNVAQALDGLERSVGLPIGSLRVIALLDSGAGVWNVREIARASERVSSVGLDERGLSRSLGIELTAGFDPFEYAKGRVIVEARAARAQPIGLTHLGDAEGLDDSEMARLALRSKNLGVRGRYLPGRGVGEPLQPRVLAAGRPAGVLPRDAATVRGGRRSRHRRRPLPWHYHDDRCASGRERSRKSGAVGTMRRPRRGEGGGCGAGEAGVILSSHSQPRVLGYECH